MSITCKVCKSEFQPMRENRYTVKKRNFFTKMAEYWDAFDCPWCGCQNVVGNRLKRVDQSGFEESDDDTNLDPPTTDCSTIKIVSWSDGTPDEIAKMLESHYNGAIDIADYWTVGDTRTITLTAIASGTTGESQSQQSVDLIIIGIKHDDKADGSGKAAVTVQTKNSLGTAGYMYSGYTSPSYSLWKDSPRRTWCNSNFKSALPTWLQNLIKPVAKVTNRHANSGYSSYRGQTNTTDDVFLLSEFETFGSAYVGGSDYGDVGSDGTQYAYMKTQANRVKSGGTNTWWLRSSNVYGSGTSYFVCVNSDGATCTLGASNVYGLAPAFCI
jgi:hypothetical protein